MEFSVLKLFILASFEARFSQATIHIVPTEGGVTGTGTTTRYWDCCKPSCAWVENAGVDPPVSSCKADGVTLADVRSQSGCVAGAAFACNAQQPIVVNDTFSLGFVAASFKGLCCACVLLSFGGELEGKQLLAQITNTGEGLVVNNFDVAIPGGGVGLYNEGCTRQWGAPKDGWGKRYGGVTSDEGCLKLPEQLQAGCHYRFTWMKGVSNPDVSFYQVECPKELTDITGCIYG